MHQYKALIIANTIKADLESTKNNNEIKDDQ